MDARSACHPAPSFPRLTAPSAWPQAARLDQRSIDAMQSADRTFSPSWKNSPSRSVNVQVRLSSDTVCPADHLRARRQRQVNAVQRVIDHVAMVDRDSCGGPDRIDTGEIGLRCATQHLGIALGNGGGASVLASAAAEALSNVLRCISISQARLTNGLPVLIMTNLSPIQPSVSMPPMKKATTIEAAIISQAARLPTNNNTYVIASLVDARDSRSSTGLGGIQPASNTANALGAA